MDNYPCNLFATQNTSPYRSNCSCNENTSCCAVLSCGSGSVGPLPITDLAGASIVNPYSVASVTLDLKKLKHPSVLITFTGLISVPASALPSLTFRTVRTCNGASHAIGGSYTFSSAIEALHSETFCFQICDCMECCDCATYTIEISNATLAQAGTTISGTVSALAVDRNCA